MLLNIVVIVPIFAALLPLIPAQTEPCTTPEGFQAACTPVMNCPPILGILNNAPRPLPQNIVTYLQRLQCFHSTGVPAVCCRRPSVGNTPTAPVTPSAPVTPVPISPASDVNTVSNDIPTGPTDVSRHPNIGLLPTTTCGPLLGDRVAFGEKTALFEYPWMALIRYEVADGFAYKCGASLITDRYVLTAAHCIARLRSGISVYSVVLGEYDVRYDTDCQTVGDETVCSPPVQEILQEAILPHPSYNTPRFANDIGLIRLRDAADMSRENIKAVCLPYAPKLQSMNLRRLVATGWGTTENNTRSDELLKVNLPVVDNARCQRAFPTLKWSPNQFCAGGENNVDTCKGDSGGPLVYPANILGQRYVQFGIVSAGLSSCGVSNGTPAVYVRVGNYMKWILDTMRP
ncbi:serine protease grass-like [Lutzomyia longipalpis]|uniref:serine protease grass-like n=1 Tax=Lutzomyia longipalpis TaxID=7200 RepID=UPI002483E6C0|nr:serine protease grass-like [Lutzomyia longipalpis]